MRSRLFAGVLGAAFALSPFAAHAAVITQNISVDINPASTLDGSTDLFPSSSFNEFNSSLGNLNSVSYTFSGDVRWTGSASPNLGLGSAGFLYAGTAFLVGSATSIKCNSYGNCNVSNSATDNFAFDLTLVTGTGSTVFDLGLRGNSGDQVSTKNSDNRDIPLTGTVTYNYTPAAVPEPLTISLFGAGLAGAVTMRRRKKAAGA